MKVVPHDVQRTVVGVSSGWACFSGISSFVICGGRTRDSNVDRRDTAAQWFKRLTEADYSLERQRTHSDELRRLGSAARCEFRP